MGVCTILADYYHGVEEVDAMDGEAHPAIAEPSHLEIEPALGIALVDGPLGVDCRPDAVVVVGGPFHFAHVTGVEETGEEDARLAWLGEVEFVALGDEGGTGLGEERRSGLHGVAY